MTLPSFLSNLPFSAPSMDLSTMGAVALAGLAVLLVFTGLIWVLRNSEKEILNAISAEPQPPLGMERALKASVVDLDWTGSLPALRVFPDPIPQAKVLRALGGRPTIVVSRGLLAALNEPELEAVLRRAFLLSRRGGLRRRSGCAAGFLRLSRWMGAPKPALTPLTPVKALRAAVFLPPAILLSGAARDLDVFESDFESPLSNPDLHWFSAAQKVDRLHRLHRSSQILDWFH